MLKSEKAYNTVVPISKELFIISVKVFTKYDYDGDEYIGYTYKDSLDTENENAYKINDHKTVNIENTIPIPIIVIIDAFI